MLRIRVGGLYIQNDQLLLVEHEKNGKHYFLLPGGGVEPEETCTEALRREFEEELSLKIETGDLLFMGEILEPLDELSGKKERRHVMQLIFAVDKIEGDIKVNCDERLRGHKFVSFKELEQIDFYPDCRQQLLAFFKKKDFQRYQQYQWK